MRETGSRPALRTRGPVAVLAVAVLALTACGGTGSGGEADGELTVLAAASLTDVFTDIAADFEERHPGTRVTLNFAGSGELAQQIASGAPADVFAAADTATMEQVVEGEGLDADWAAEHGTHGLVFATNTLRIAVPPDNPAGIETFADLAADGVQVAVCAEQVPCGAATRTAMDASGVEVTPVTLEEDVRAVLTKVELGEVDAGLVYATDVDAARGRVEGLEFPGAEEAVNEYPIGVLAGSDDTGLAATWVDAVVDGTDVLSDAGFGTP
ncbi:molybdate ABC transporter substrate-binding protein [Nocardiopsis sp. NRRL B-16309]|uniref:molybdate ABC transporter substrate-binding protein n=1 Tax=Nocardiopsis sp. NRRL B-16309 TaxID=1519494 RepID=UPI0006AFA24A|nr:molybdate ABC transporter substrate-binding protein [Nocardiopsis sp. NRRL B-16309]KOX13779.1 molybdate-binding protein [Nocardiopsis sp. NRRL B-16309]